MLNLNCVTWFNGNTVLGGVDSSTGMTYGFDPGTGAPDTGRSMSEEEIFGGLLGVIAIIATFCSALIYFFIGWYLRNDMVRSYDMTIRKQMA